MVLNEIKERYSVRNFSEKEVSDEKIKNVLEAGRLAPSWLNIQPWHFVVVKNKQNKILLSQMAHGQPHVEKAPVVIVCCADKNAWEKDNFKKILESKAGITEERVTALLGNSAYNPKLKGENAIVYRSLEELTYAIAYMTIEAKSQGLGTCVVGGIGNDLTESVPEVYNLTKGTLNLPNNLMIMTLLVLGYPDENDEKPMKQRKSFEDVVSFELYQEKN